MDVFVVGIIAGVVGLAIGVGGILAFRYSELSRRSDDLQSDSELPEGIAEVLAVLPSAAIVIDAGDDVVKASPSAYTYGLIRGHVLANDLLLEAVSRVRIRGLIEEMDFEQPRSRQSSITRHLHARVAPLGPQYVLVLCDDRTESHRVDEVRRDFVANVSHELKTPVGAIALLAEAVADSADDEDAVRRFGSRMQRESHRLTQLVQEIIDLSRVQDHISDQEGELLDANSLVHEAVDRAKTAADAKRIRISVVDGEAWSVFGTRELLVNALRNIIDNAVHYSNEDTQVGIGVRLVDERVAISVTDQGIGMSKDDTERVFERFYRVDPARSRQTGGTGLGLSIVKHVVATHGGEVQVWSELGSGSTFTVSLPQHNDAQNHLTVPQGIVDLTTPAAAGLTQKED